MGSRWVEPSGSVCFATMMFASCSLLNVPGEYQFCEAMRLPAARQPLLTIDGQDDIFRLLEENAIKRFDPETRRMETVVQDDAILWPDTFTHYEEGPIYFTTAQIHLGPPVTQPYRIFRIEED